MLRCYDFQHQILYMLNSPERAAGMVGSRNCCQAGRSVSGYFFMLLLYMFCVYDVVKCSVAVGETREGQPGISNAMEQKAHL